ncbi:MAG: AAA family ATPase [Pseudomonadota bacterium]
MSDLARHMRAIVETVRGEPNKRHSKPGAPRWGTNGSLSVDEESGTYFDHEAGVGGGVLGFIEAEVGRTGKEAFDWMRSKGLDVGSPESARLQIIETYDYCDANGNLAYQVVRLEPKSFRQRRPDGLGGWTWSLGETKPLPYRLPDIIKNNARAVYIVEGEKDADLLWSLGAPATCNSGGAGKFDASLLDCLEGRKLCIIADADKAGIEHARDIHAKATARGMTAAILQLSGLDEKGDVSDWIAKGGTREELSSLAKEAFKTPDDIPPVPEVEPDLEALDAASKLLTRLTLGTSIEIIKDRPYVFKGLLWANTVAVIYGAPGSAKSFAALDMAVHYAKGQDWRGHRVQGGKVVYVAAEGGVGMVNRVAAIGDAPDTFGLLTTRLDLRTSSLAARAVVIMAREAMGGDFGMIIIDTLARSLGGGEDSSGVDMGLFVENCDCIRELTGAAVVVIHHTGKDATKGARGSTVLLGAIDTELRVEIEGDLRVMTVTKQKDGPEGTRYAFTLENVDLGTDSELDPILSARVVHTEAPDQKARLSRNEGKALEALREYLMDHGKPVPGGTNFPEPGSRQCVERDAFLGHLTEKMANAELKERKRAAKTALGGLVEKSVVQINGGKLWII